MKIKNPYRLMYIMLAIYGVILIGFISFSCWYLKAHPPVGLPEEWKAISHDPKHPTELNAVIDSSGIVQESFK